MINYKIAKCQNNIITMDEFQFMLWLYENHQTSIEKVRREWDSIKTENHDYI